MDYYRAYLKGKDGVVKETIADFDIYLKEASFNYGVEVKDIPSNSWHDEDGEEEYIPEEGLKLKAFEVTLEWAYKGAAPNTTIKNFCDYLLANSPFEYIYDEYNRIKYRDVRFVKLHDDAELVKQQIKAKFTPARPLAPTVGGDEEYGEGTVIPDKPSISPVAYENILLFKTTMKVNSPRLKNI